MNVHTCKLRTSNRVAGSLETNWIHSPASLWRAVMVLVRQKLIAMELQPHTHLCKLNPFGDCGHNVTVAYHPSTQMNTPPPVSQSSNNKQHLSKVIRPKFSTPTCKIACKVGNLLAHAFHVQNPNFGQNPLQQATQGGGGGGVYKQAKRSPKRLKPPQTRLKSASNAALLA